MTKKRLMEKLRAIDNQLSPENLTCDGEANPSWVRKEYNRLNRERSRVIVQLGYEPTVQEIWGFKY